MSTTSKQAQWVAEVKSRPGSMTQRKESVVESWPGGMAELVREAKSQNVHLVRVTDDQGVTLIAASVHPFDVLS
jgi:hypothetical protein